MTVNQLRELLTKIEGFGDAEVLAFDADSGRMEPVSGVVWGKDKDGNGHIELQTDDPS